MKLMIDIPDDAKEWELPDIINKGIPIEECDDCVSRQAAIDACLNGWNKDYKEIVEEIRALPPVNPAEKVGRWKRISMDKYSEHAKYWYRCDRCGEDNLGNTNYCPNCGAKMQEVEE